MNQVCGNEEESLEREKRRQRKVKGDRQRGEGRAHWRCSQDELFLRCIC